VMGHQVQTNISILVLLVAPLQKYQMVWYSQADLSLMVLLIVNVQTSQMSIHHWARACAFLLIILASPMQANFVPIFWG
jgi:hypothetical protein